MACQAYLAAGWEAPSGGDVAFEMGFVIVAFGYFVFRTIEIR